MADAWESAASTQCQRLANECAKKYADAMDPDAVDGTGLGPLPLEESVRATSHTCAPQLFPGNHNDRVSARLSLVRLQVLRGKHDVALGDALRLYDRLAPTAPMVSAKFRTKVEVRGHVLCTCLDPRFLLVPFAQRVVVVDEGYNLVVHWQVMSLPQRMSLPQLLSLPLRWPWAAGKGRGSVCRGC